MKGKYRWSSSKHETTTKQWKISDNCFNMVNFTENPDNGNFFPYGIFLLTSMGENVTDISLLSNLIDLGNQNWIECVIFFHFFSLVL